MICRVSVSNLVPGEGAGLQLFSDDEAFVFLVVGVGSVTASLPFTACLFLLTMVCDVLAEKRIEVLAMLAADFG